MPRHDLLRQRGFSCQAPGFAAGQFPKNVSKVSGR
jgi:hypothetical protein